jgi:hypothetical protein
MEEWVYETIVPYMRVEGDSIGRPSHHAQPSRLYIIFPRPASFRPFPASQPTLGFHPLDGRRDVRLAPSSITPFRSAPLLDWLTWHYSSLRMSLSSLSLWRGCCCVVSSSESIQIGADVGGC